MLLKKSVSVLNMPRRFRRKPRMGARRPKRFTKRRTTHRRHRRDAPTRTISKQIGGFPERYFCKFRYTGDNNMPATSTTAYFTWAGDKTHTIGPSVNGGSITTGAPPGIHYLYGSSTGSATAPYQSVRVWGSAIKIRYTPTSAGPTQLDCVLFPSLLPASDPTLTAYGASSLQVVSGQPFAKTRTIVGGETNKPLFMKHMMNLRRIHGIKHKAAAEALFINSIDTENENGSTWYWNFHIFGDGGMNLTGRITYEIVIFCEFFNRTSLLTATVPT